MHATGATTSIVVLLKPKINQALRHHSDRCWVNRPTVETWPYQLSSLSVCVSGSFWPVSETSKTGAQAHSLRVCIQRGQPSEESGGWWKLHQHAQRAETNRMYIAWSTRTFLVICYSTFSTIKKEDCLRVTSPITPLLGVPDHGC